MWQPLQPASHTVAKRSLEGAVIADAVRRETGVPCVEFEVPPVSDGVAASLGTRLEALIETARARRGSRP